MITETRTVRPQSGFGEEHRAEFLICDKCGEDEWFCFIVEGHTHSHFQCSHCGTSYCPDGLCKGEEPSAH